MAWLEDLAKERNYKSLRALALSVRESKDWPADDVRSAETLANRLRDADKEKDLEWWLPGGAGASLLAALASELGVAVDDLANQFQTARDQSSGASEHLWRFDQFPGLRPLDLRTEMPFPGIPRQLLPDGPAARLTWWTGPDGAGRTLVGKWLAINAGWQHRANLTWKEVERLAPGRYFVELDDVPDDVLAASWLSDQLQLCVASRSRLPKPGQPKDGTGETPSNRQPTTIPSTENQRPPDPDGETQQTAGTVGQEQERSAGWVEVATPPAGEWLDDLTVWAVSRLEPGKPLDLAAVRAVLKALDAHALLESPGDALGLLGAIARVTPEALATLDSADGTVRLWRAWLDLVLQRTLEANADAPAGQEVDQFQALTLQLVAARVEAGLPASNSLATWYRLVPSGAAPALNPLELRELVRNNPPDLRERLAEMLASDAEAVVKNLIHKRVLERDGETWRLGPRWVQRSLELSAFHRLMQSARGMGALLLGGVHVDKVMGVLLQACTSPSSGELLAIARQADVSEPEDAAFVAGLQIALGVSAARGGTVRTDDLQRGWVELQLPLVHRYTQYPAAPPILKQEMGHAGRLFSLELWYFAAMVTALRFAEQGLAVDQLPFDVDAQAGSPARDALERSLQLAGHLYAANDAPGLGVEVRRAMFGFGSELLKRHGNKPLLRGQLRCQEPALLVQLAAGNPEVDTQLSDDAKMRLLTLDFELSALGDACTRYDSTVSAVLQWCWRQWTGKFRKANQVWPPYAWRNSRYDANSARDLQEVWRALPADLIDADLAQFVWDKDWVWPALTPQHWEALFALWRQQDPPPWIWMRSRSELPLGDIPDHLLLAAVRAGELQLVHEHMGSAMWERLPVQLVALLDELVATAFAEAWHNPEQVDPIFQLVYSSPHNLTHELLDRTALWTENGMPGFASSGWIVRWWLRVVDERRPDWRRAFHLLGQRAVTPPRLSAPAV